MLTLQLQTEIDKKWEACWPVSQIKPLVFLDLLSYLFFIKKIEELYTQKQNGKSLVNTLIFSKEQDELRWSRFTETDAHSIYKLFTKENGVIDFITIYGQSNQKYSLFVKEPLYLIPTAGLLASTIEIIKTIEQQDAGKRGEIFQYLINKVQIVTHNGQVYAPDYVAELMVALLQPKTEDLILDPIAGNGSFLVSCIKHIVSNAPATGKNNKKDYLANKCRGVESDPVQLRIAAMNMLLNGIDDPLLEKVNIFKKININLPEPSALILANLIFRDYDHSKGMHSDNLKKDAYSGKEIEFLNFIINNLKSGGQAAIIVPTILLYDNRIESSKLRQRLVEELTLDAIISLPAKADSMSSGTGILIFSKTAPGTTKKTWFYKMNQASSSSANRDEFVKSKSLTETAEGNEVMNILRIWKNRERNRIEGGESNSLYIPMEEIKNNNYNLSFNQYKSIEAGGGAGNKNENIDSTKASFFATPDKQPPEPPLVKGSRLKEISPGKKRLVIILALVFIVGIALAFYFLSDKNNNKSPLSGPNTSINPGEIAETFSQDSIRKLPPQNKAVHDSSASGQTPRLPPLTASATIALKEKYKVIAKAYFHEMPDERTRRKAYINHWNNIVLSPISDKDGFIYIIYTNQFGRTSKGWLNKKDLKAL